MTELDKYLMGMIGTYTYKRYDWEYGFSSLLYKERFKLIFDVDIKHLLSGYRNDVAKFKGFYDLENGKLYVDSTYYNELYEGSGLDKILISDVQKEMALYVINKYNEYIKSNKAEFKALAFPKFKEFYDVEYNSNTLKEKAEQEYLSSVDYTQYRNFEISVPNEFQNVIDYIIDKDKFADNIINNELDKTGYSIGSGCCGVADMPVNQREYVGFKLLQAEKLNEMMKDIDEDKVPNSSNLKKLRSISKFVGDNPNVKNVIIGLVHNDKQLEIQYPMEHLKRLDIDDWWMPLKYRNEFNEMFSDLKYGESKKKILSVQYIKYKGKIVWEYKEVV